MSELLLDTELSEAESAPLARAMETAFIADVPLVLELLFVSPEEIRAAELCPGDVILSSAHADCVEPALDGETEKMYLGSVVICTDRARAQAEEYGHSYAREVCYLAVHGFLHCLGYDHMTEEERRVMREQEEKIMGVLGLGREE